MDEAENQNNRLEHKEEKKSTQSEQEEEKRIQRNKGLGTCGTTLNIPISESLRCQKEKRKNKKLKTYLKK